MKEESEVPDEVKKELDIRLDNLEKGKQNYLAGRKLKVI
jgi:hypothetical protein